MEHLAFFSLANDPFRNDPELDLFFRGSPQRSASRRLLRLARQGKELSILTGDSGVGKTTLLRSFFEELEPEAFEPALLVVSRGVEPEWLRRGLAAQLGVESPAEDRATGIRELYHRLVEIHREGRRCLVLIDEAQALGDSGLAEIRSWMNLESDERKILSFLFVGNDELEDTLKSHAGLFDRVEAQVCLEGFSQEESREYLEHRLKRVGGHAGVFEDVAYGAIADLARGLPRRLNALADNALFEAYLAGRTPATPQDVEAAAANLPWTRGASPAELAGELSDPNNDSLDYVAAAFGPVSLRSSDSLGVGATKPGIEAEGNDESGDLFNLDDSISSALADFDSHGNAAIDNEVSVGALRESDLDASPNADFIDSDVLTPEPAPPEPPKPAETPAPPPASAKGVESRSVVPDDDEIEGLFENLVQDD